MAVKSLEGWLKKEAEGLALCFHYRNSAAAPFLLNVAALSTILAVFSGAKTPSRM